jgi:exoribonuclease R
MARIPIVCSTDQHELCAAMAQIREELEIRTDFSDEVVEEAIASAVAGPQIPPGSGGTTVADRTDLPLVTIDPPSSMDLDQAFAGEKTASGWRVFYAIADVAAWVAPGGPIDQESQARGFTMYSPDARAPLHPAELSEAAASLLPDQDRQSLLWTIDLDDAGHLLDATLERAMVRSRAKLSYRDAADGIERGDDPVLASLREIGLRREALEVERGAVSLNLATQEVVATDAGFDLVYDESLPVEGWNAQISLLTGIAAAKIMLDGGIGILRTLPRPRTRTIKELRLVARALDVDWPESATYADTVRSLDPSDPREAALIAQSARGLRGAGYVAFDGELPELTEHSAIAANYAHVTAPLRRLGDRYANECVLAVQAGTRPPDWVLEALPELPAMLGRARNKEGALERSTVDLVEAALLSGSVGQTYSGLITNVDEDKARVRVQLKDPAVVAYADGVGELGDVASVRLTDADVAKRRVRFELID